MNNLSSHRRFDFGDWTPQNTTGVPFIQLLSTTDAKKAADTFKSIRDKQVCANDESLAKSGTGAGSIELGQIQTGKPRPMPLARRQLDHSVAHGQHMMPTNGRMRVIVSTHRVPMQFKIPFLPHAVNKCASKIVENHGPAILALLSGLIALAVGAAIAGIIVAVKVWRQRKAEQSGYVPIQIKDEEESY